MTWNETHRRTQVLREIEALIASTSLPAEPPAPLAWHTSYDALFGDRDGLVAWLRYRWQLRLADPELDATHPALAVARAGLAMLVGEEVRRVAA